MTWQVEESPNLYVALVGLCRHNYAEEGLSGVCSLRSQLIMSVHDAWLQGGGIPASAGELDRCYNIAVLTDACVKARHRSWWFALPLRRATIANGQVRSELQLLRCDWWALCRMATATHHGWQT